MSQVNPDAIEPITSFGTAETLQSACITVISRQLHTYALDSLQDLPSHLVQRVMSRVINDREYDQDPYLSSRRPDEATLWVIHALSDPETASPTHTIALPTNITIAHLARRPTWTNEPDHPLNALPPRFEHLDCAFLTTLTLMGTDGSVTDSTIQSLKWCTHLTGLWMRGCYKVSDDGIRSLTTSLELPRPAAPGRSAEPGRGMWKLRCWSIRGCRRISDKSMKSFAKWPGLTMLGEENFALLTPDVRSTSCTSAAMSVFNRASHVFFGDLQPKFQPCTSNLRPLFITGKDPDRAMENLAGTLIQADIPKTGFKGPRPYLALHVLTGAEPPFDKWLHGSLTQKTKEESAARSFVPGVGFVYGQGSETIAEEAERRRPTPNWTTPYVPNKYKSEAKEFNVEYEEEWEEIKGSSSFMMVRLVNPQWQQLQWQRPVVESAAAPVKVTRKACVTVDAAALITQVTGRPAAAVPPSTPTPHIPSSSPSSASSVLVTPTTSPVTHLRKWNAKPHEPRSSPFTAQKPTPSAAGTRNPFAAGGVPEPTPPPAAMAPKEARAAAIRQSLAMPMRTPVKPAKPAPPLAKTPDDPLAFVTRKIKPLANADLDPLAFVTAKKRSWGSLGSRPPEKPKKNTKLFSKK